MNLPMVMIFFVSKLLKYGLFLVFLFLLMSGVKNLGGYSREQIIIFYLVFNLIDTLGQLLFREVYYFRPLVISGNFDMVLTKPFNPLIRVLLGGPDLIDTGVFVILVGVLSNFVRLDSFLIFYFVLMLINSLLITAAFYISILAIGILTLSVDHLIMIYRDLSSLMRIPVDIFTNPLWTLLTFIIPIGIMFTFPAKVLFGLLSWQLILFSFLFGVVSLFLSLKFWNYSLRQYQSASS